MTSHLITEALARQRADEIARRPAPRPCRLGDVAPAASVVLGILLAIAIGAPIGL